METSHHRNPRWGGEGLQWQRWGQGPDTERGVSLCAQCLLVFLPALNRRRQSAWPVFSPSRAVSVRSASFRLFLGLFLDQGFPRQE